MTGNEDYLHEGVELRRVADGKGMGARRRVPSPSIQAGNTTPTREVSMTRNYVYRTTVTIGDTNLLQNMYFVNHFKLTGIARELWLHEHVPDALSEMQAGLVLITREASCLFHKDFKLFDPVRLELWFERMRNTSVEIKFNFFHDLTNSLHAEARQVISFAAANHKTCRMPGVFRSAFARFIPTGEDHGEDKS